MALYNEQIREKNHQMFIVTNSHKGLKWEKNQSNRKIRRFDKLEVPKLGRQGWFA